MSHSYFTGRLAPLASERYQMQFGVSASSSEYVVASELLQGACECIEKLEGKPFHGALVVEAQSFSPEVKSHLQEIKNLLQSKEGLALENLDWSSLMKHPVWLAIRLHASGALSGLGVILEEWEKEELEAKNAL